MRETEANNVRLVLIVAYMVGIHLLSVLPGDDAAGDSALLRWRVSGPLANSLHVIVYAGLAWLWHRYFEARPLQARTVALMAVGIATAYGTFNEWVQLYVPGRSADVGDICFNFFGALGGTWLAVWMSKRFGDKSRRGHPHEHLRDACPTGKVISRPPR